MLKIFVMLALSLALNAQAQMPVTEISVDQAKFDFLSSDGGFWVKCSHSKEEQPHSWAVRCGEYKFSLHMFLRQYIRQDEATFEFHYWATETSALKETHTQSTWLTVDKESKTKKIVSYLGFSQDALQFRVELNLK